jgi:hypothetical protein
LGLLDKGLPQVVLSKEKQQLGMLLWDWQQRCLHPLRLLAWLPPLQLPAA